VRVRVCVWVVVSSAFFLFSSQSLHTCCFLGCLPEEGLVTGAEDIREDSQPMRERALG